MSFAAEGGPAGDCGFSVMVGKSDLGVLEYSSGVASRTETRDIPLPLEYVTIVGTAVNSLFGPKVVGV